MFTLVQGPRSVDTTVFFNVKPKLADLSNELGDLTWSEIKSLAVQLEIDYNKLLKIEEQTNQATDRMHQALNIWLKKDPNASWEKVINALDRVKGKDVLIKTLKEKYLPQSPGILQSDSVSSFRSLLCLSITRSTSWWPVKSMLFWE